MDAHLFVCFSSKDQEVAMDVVECLEREGLKCWIQLRDVRAGHNYQETIVQALESAKGIIFLFSENSSASGEVKKELSIAATLNLPVFPLRLAPIKPTGALRYELATRQWIDIFEDQEEALHKLAETIRQVLNNSATEAEAPVTSSTQVRPPSTDDRVLASAPTPPNERTRARATTPTSAAPHLSMVVLPFVNLSTDPGQDYFVDGIVATLTTDVSRIPHSFVIARSTAFTYKNKVVDARQFGQELGVRYLIQGSIQCAGTRLRVTVQLINAVTGSHLWAERFDCDRGDIFEIQDEIVTHLARTLDVELVAAESKRAALSPDLRSLDLTFHGWAAMNRGLNPDNLKEARRFFEQALVLDPNNVMALAGLADANSTLIVAYMTDDRAACLVATESTAMKALALAPNEAKAHASLALVYMCTNRLSQAISEYERALTLDRNLAFAHANIGIAKYIAGRSQETEDHIARAIRLSPKDAWLNAWCVAAGVAKLSLCRDEEAATWLRRAIEANRSLPLAHFFLASALALQGKTQEALEAAKAGLALDPGFTIRRYRDNPLSDNSTYLTQRKRIHEGMFTAGVPEN